MLTPDRSLVLNADSGAEMPRIAELEDLYRMGVKFRQGQVQMIVGRSGTQKSGLALWLAANWGLPTIYFSADMSAFTASSRLACLATGHRTEEVEYGMARGGRRAAVYTEALRSMPIRFSFGSPITWESVEDELDAQVELTNAYPQVMVFDNLMDFAGAESDYTAQMEVMSIVTELARETGSTCLLLHHASDKSFDKNNPWAPPSREQVKGGMSEKPELSLSVGLDPNSLEFRIACIKQRMGPCDPTGERNALLRIDPERTRFHRFNTPEVATR